MIAREALIACIPTSKHDHAAVQRARAVGFPSLNPVIPNLLEWLQDMSWPVADPVTDLLLLAAVPDLEAPILDVLRTEDAIWKYWVLDRVVRRSTGPLPDTLRTEIVRIARFPRPSEQGEDVHIVAQEVLAKRGGA